MNICDILKNAETIAVVGISKNPFKTSRGITRYLKSEGYKIFGVNPTIDDEEIDGIKIYKSLKEIPVGIDIVDVFRRSEDIPELIPDIEAVKPKVLWLQAGIRNDDAVAPLIEQGIEVIQDRCIYVEHSNCF